MSTLGRGGNPMSHAKQSNVLPTKIISIDGTGLDDWLMASASCPENV